ncbi:hypothetical protein [Amycolatopsis alba]|nr:hypothetical protein [Amycolatopsis alba]
MTAADASALPCLTDVIHRAREFTHNGLAQAIVKFLPTPGTQAF